jgi:hypothetical protein
VPTGYISGMVLLQYKNIMSDNFFVVYLKRIIDSSEIFSDVVIERKEALRIT